MAPEESAKAPEAQAKALGAKPSAVYVSHPIQDRTDEEMVAIADQAVQQLIDAIVS